MITVLMGCSNNPLWRFKELRTAVDVDDDRNGRGLHKEFRGSTFFGSQQFKDSRIYPHRVNAHHVQYKKTEKEIWRQISYIEDFERN